MQAKKEGKKMKEYLRKGSGIMLVGTYIIVILIVMFAYFANTTLLRVHAYDTQMSADAISDGVAEYMLSGGETYDDAEKEASRLKKLLEKYAGIKITDIKIDKKSMNDDKISVDLTAKKKTFGFGKYVSAKTYKYTRHSASSYIGAGLANLGPVVEWARASKATARYGQGNSAFPLPRAALTSDGRISSTDCSGFVWMCYVRMGCSVASMWATGSMDQYFDRISPSQARPGDVLFCTAAERGTTYGHARLYLGNGKFIDMGTSGIKEGTIDINNLGPYHFGRIKKQYMK